MSTPTASSSPRAPAGQHLGIALAVIVTCQLMVVLDASVVNIALPKIQGDLGFSATSLSWVMNAYALAFGGLLLLGGRTGDLLGRRRTFIGGLVVFTIASLLGGLATSDWQLLGARAVQGVGAAFAAPSALALITTTFAEGPARNRALGVFAAMSATGASIGLILGGILTDAASWRWVMFINVPFGIALVLLAPRYVAESVRHRGRFDLGGALTGTLGIGSLVYGFIRVSESSWGDTVALASFTAAVALLATFVALESRAPQPILPLRLLANRIRAGAYLNMLLLAGAMFAMFYFLTQYLQDVHGMGPLTTGLAFLPLTAGIFTLSRIMPRVLPRTGPRRPLIVGMSLIIAGLLWLTQLSPDTSYVGGLLGPMVLFGIGGGMSFLPITVTILNAVEARDSGAASGVLQTMQQGGGALGIAILVSVFASERRDALAHPAAGLGPVERAHEALSQGMTSAFGVAAIFAAISLAVAVLVLRPSRASTDDGGTVPAPASAG